MLVIRKLGFESFTAQISLRDPANKEKYIGSDENWAKAEQAIIDATLQAGLETNTVLGEAAFMDLNWILWSRMPLEEVGNWAPSKSIIIYRRDSNLSTLVQTTANIDLS